jgi:broad specificity phosphatase PhoE
MPFMDAAATLVLLVRHGHAAPVDRWLAGRRAGIPLSEHGRQQASALAGAIDASPLRPVAIYASPLERAWETASALAAAPQLPVVIREALTDVEYGAWTGKTLHELSVLAEWHAYNADREHSRPPGGESLGEAGRRLVAELERARSLHPGQAVVVVSHADPIRAALAHYTSTPLNDALRVTVPTASTTVLELTGGRATVLGLALSPTELRALTHPAAAPADLD